MKDGMKQADGASVELACGHPGVKAGDVCPLCGMNLPLEETQNGDSPQRSEGV